MPNYRFTGLTPLFYPDERGDDGRSLMALPGDVHDWSRTPDDGQWAMVTDAPEPVQEALETPADPEPEPVQETPELVLAPVDIPADPEPAPAPVAPAEPIPSDPAPEPDSELPPAVRDWFAAMGQTPPARA